MFLFSPHSFVYNLPLFFPRFSEISYMRVTFDHGVGGGGKFENYLLGEFYTEVNFEVCRKLPFMKLFRNKMVI